MMFCIWTNSDPSQMLRKLRCFWLKVPKIFADARCVARIAHTDADLKNLQWLLIFQLHVRRLFVRRSKYLVLRPSMAVYGLRAGTGAIASSSALNYGGFFWNSSNSLADGSSTKKTLSHWYSSLPSICFSRDFPAWSMQYLPVKRECSEGPFARVSDFHGESIFCSWCVMTPFDVVVFVIDELSRVVVVVVVIIVV